MKYIFLSLFIFIKFVYADETITIGATPIPQAQILKQVKPILKKQGIDLVITEFNDYIQPNLLVWQKQLDANFYQHRPFLQQFNKEHGIDLVELTDVEIEPMGFYASNDQKFKEFVSSKKLDKLAKVREDSPLLIGVPNDTTNEGRALLLLEKNGLIKIKKGVSYPTKTDIIANPFNIVIKELDSAMLPRALISKQLSFAVINSNYALDANLNPVKDAIFIEAKDSPYVNIIVVRKESLNLPKMKKLVTAIHSKEVRDFIKKTYKNSIIATF